MIGFDAIEYEKDGIRTWRTSLDTSFGVPKRVRFLTEPPK